MSVLNTTDKYLFRVFHLHILVRKCDALHSEVIMDSAVSSPKTDTCCIHILERMEEVRRGQDPIRSDQQVRRQNVVEVGPES